MNPFTSPTTIEFFVNLCDSLLSESDRGAVIIGSANIEEELEKAIVKMLPQKSKTYKRKLFDYPGLLSSFSAKIELAYAFRYININTRNSLNSLRSLRNKAAHSSGSFLISDNEGVFSKIFDLGPSFRKHVSLRSMELMVKLKFENIKILLDETSLSEKDQRDIINSLISDQEVRNKLKNQLAKWELIYGLSVLCEIIKHEFESKSESLVKLN